MTQPEINLHGVSICPAGEENYERYKDFYEKWLYQYDYRDTDGELFTFAKQHRPKTAEIEVSHTEDYGNTNIRLDERIAGLKAQGVV